MQMLCKDVTSCCDLKPSKHSQAHTHTRRHTHAGTHTEGTHAIRYTYRHTQSQTHSPKDTHTLSSTWDPQQQLLLFFCCCLCICIAHTYDQLPPSSPLSPLPLPRPAHLSPLCWPFALLHIIRNFCLLPVFVFGFAALFMASSPPFSPLYLPSSTIIKITAHWVSLPAPPSPSPHFK